MNHIQDNTESDFFDVLFEGLPGGVYFPVSQIVDNNFPTVGQYSTPDGVRKATAGGRDVYIPANGMHYVRGGGRGKIGDVKYYKALVRDIDVGKGPGYPATKEDACKIVGSYAVEPSFVISTGSGGLQPWWILDEAVEITDDNRAWVRSTSARWEELCRRVEEGLGYRLDVGLTKDIVHVWRVPGSLHAKDPANVRPVTVVDDIGTGEAVSLDTIVDLLDSSGIPAYVVSEDAAGNITATQAQERIAEWLRVDGMCRKVETTARKYVESVEAGEGGSHPPARAGCLALVRLGEQGHAGAAAALDSLRDAFLTATGGGSKRTQDWQRMFIGAIAKVDANPTPEHLKGCRCAPEDTSREDWYMQNQSLWEVELNSRIGISRTLAGLFVRGDAIVRVPRIGEEGYVRLTEAEEDDDGPAQVRGIDATDLTALVQRGWRCFVLTKDGEEWKEKEILPPSDACKIAYRSAVQGLSPNVRRLRGVVHTPVLRKDGTVLSEPGYDDATGLLYLPLQGLEVPEIPENPTREQVAAARELLESVIQDFPFVTEDDRANYLGAWITPALRNIEPGPYFLVCINAPMLGSGKSLLAKIFQSTYGAVWRGPIPHDGEEIRKQLTSILHTTTAPVVVWDNVIGVHRSPEISSMVTSKVSNDRPLGSTANVSVRNDRMWVFTGNNIQLGGDNARRGLWVTIDPRGPAPWNRTGFAIDNPDQYVAENRGRIIAAILTLIRAWYAAGCPRQLTRSDSFASYAATVGGILEIAGVKGEFMAEKTNKAEIGEDDAEWADYLDMLSELVDDTGIHDVRLALDAAKKSFDAYASDDDTYRRERIRAALPPRVLEALDDYYRGGVSRAATLLGYMYRDREGRWAGPYTARAVIDPDTGKHKKHPRTRRVMWRLEKMPEPPKHEGYAEGHSSVGKGKSIQQQPPTAAVPAVVAVVVAENPHGGLGRSPTGMLQPSQCECEYSHPGGDSVECRMCGEETPLHGPGLPVCAECLKRKGVKPDVRQ